MTNAREILNFLKELANHNDRDWFAENKSKYTSAMEKFKESADRLIAMTGVWDDDIKYLQAKDCVYRIYRDIRFSPDKSPYKRHMAAYLARGGRKSLRAGYYLHIQPGGKSLIAGGLYELDGKMMKHTREVIDTCAEDFLPIVNEKEFKENFSFEDDKLKRMPLGFSADSPVAEYLKCRSFTVWHGMDDDFFDSDDWEEKVERLFRIMKPYNDFMNGIMEEMEM